LSQKYDNFFLLKLLLTVSRINSSCLPMKVR